MQRKFYSQKGENNHLLVLDISAIFHPRKKMEKKKEEVIDACAETFSAGFPADAAVWQLAGSSNVGGWALSAGDFRTGQIDFASCLVQKNCVRQIRTSEAVVCRNGAEQEHVPQSGRGRERRRRGETVMVSALLGMCCNSGFQRYD